MEIAALNALSLQQKQFDRFWDGLSDEYSQRLLTIFQACELTQTGEHLEIIAPTLEVEKEMGDRIVRIARIAKATLGITRVTLHGELGITIYP